MKHSISKFIEGKYYSRETVVAATKRWKFLGKKIVFTNGVFDLLHDGHLKSLHEAASHGDILLIGLNSDASVKKLKGDSRPIQGEATRSAVLANLFITDGIILFDADTPLELIKLILPDVLVKGGDYEIKDIAGAKEVIAAGGEVIIVPILAGHSTSNTVAKMRKADENK